MPRFSKVGCAVVVLTMFAVTTSRAMAQTPAALVDKGIKALGGEEKLSKIKAANWKIKGKLSFMGNDNEFTSQATIEGLDHYNSSFEGDFNGNKVKATMIIAGDKGWRKFGDMGMELDKDSLANEKRTVYLSWVPATLVDLKGKNFKLAAGGEAKVGDAAAVSVKVTDANGKEFELFFDKVSGLPVKLSAKVQGFMGEEFTQETLFKEYKDFKGIKKATKTESLRDGEKFIEQEITEFKVLDKVPDGTFDEPK